MLKIFLYVCIIYINLKIRNLSLSKIVKKNPNNKIYHQIKKPAIPRFWKSKTLSK